MNIKKLTQWNMARPINQRLHVESVQEKTSLFAARGAMLALMATVHAEIEPALQAKRRADDLLDRCVRTSHEKQGYVNEPGSARLEIHTMRPCAQFSDLATENDSVGACLLAGMDKGETTTRNVSANS